jgi:hypothetical protein
MFLGMPKAPGKQLAARDLGYKRLSNARTRDKPFWRGGNLIQEYLFGD